MISKKAQQEIIVTVLLVLIALAAVAAVATFVIKQVKTSTASADDKQNCLKVELDITTAKVGGTVINVQRTGDGSIATAGIRVLVKGVALANMYNITAGATQNYTATANLAAGDKVEALAVLQSGYVCQTAAETLAA